MSRSPIIFIPHARSSPCTSTILFNLGKSISIFFSTIFSFTLFLIIHRIFFSMCLFYFGYFLSLTFQIIDYFPTSVSFVVQPVHDVFICSGFLWFVEFSMVIFQTDWFIANILVSILYFITLNIDHFWFISDCFIWNFWRYRSFFSVLLLITSFLIFSSLGFSLF